MKKGIIAVVVIFIVAVGVFVMRDSIFGVSYKDGVYWGEYQAEDGENTKVTLTLKEGKIVDCVLEAYDDMGRIKDEKHGSDGSAEDFRRAQRAVREMKKYPGMLIEVQDIDKLDVIAGASITHRAMQYAVREALKKAR